MDPSSWDVSKVVEYLQKIELGQYAESFIKNNIDGATLIQLNEKKLKDLGIKSIGHRIKLNHFIHEIGNNYKSDPQQKESTDSIENKTEQKVDTDSIHPLDKSIHFQMYLKETEDKMQNNESFMQECKICHQKIPITFYDHHEKSCRNIFLQCQREYQRRGINLTNNDIIDLMNGKVPIHHIKLKKCHYCGRKFAPSTFSKHEIHCREKMILLKSNQPPKNSTQKPDSNDFRKKHEQLIQFIKSQRKEMNQIFLSDTYFPVVKMEATEAF